MAITETLTLELLKTLVERRLVSLASEFTDDNISDAIDEAQRETGFTVPTANNDQVRWLIKRSVRHLYAILLEQASQEFQIKQIKMDQKFTNLAKLIETMDAEYNREKRRIDFGLDISPVQMFGTRLDSKHKRITPADSDD